jgi:hypothetical protein
MEEPAYQTPKYLEISAEQGIGELGRPTKHALGFSVRIFPLYFFFQFFFTSIENVQIFLKKLSYKIFIFEIYSGFK